MVLKTTPVMMYERSVRRHTASHCILWGKAAHVVAVLKC